MAPPQSALAENIDEKRYDALPTLKRFHESPAQIRCIVGPVGSGKTTAATWETCYYIAWFLYKTYGIKKTRGVIVRNTYAELIDTTQRTVFEWFDWGGYKTQSKNYTLKYPNGIEIEILFRSCDRPQDVKKFKSLEITWYWIDESIEVADEVKKMLKNRLGRFPRKCPVRFGIETTNPPDIEHPTYYQFAWDTPPPGPVAKKQPLKNHAGFWQPPHENDANLRPGYYDELRLDYADSLDWVDMYIDGKPGVIVRGKLVYHNFKRRIHVANAPMVWSGGQLYRGWDDSGNTPACIVVSNPSPMRLHFHKEFCHDRMNIVHFAEHVVNQCNVLFPGANWTDYDDPAGWNKFSKKEGGFTSNAQLIQEATGIQMIASEQNLTARLNAVDGQLALIDGMLIDPSCTRFINGFLGGYCYPQMGLTGEYSDKIDKNRFSHIHDAAQYVSVRLVKQKSHKKTRRKRRRRNAMAV
jgi:hypothetical protein